jgi:hypothetical protein
MANVFIFPLTENLTLFACLSYRISLFPKTDQPPRRHTHFFNDNASLVYKEKPEKYANEKKTQAPIQNPPNRCALVYALVR